ARFGRWFIWVGPAAYLLVDRESGQVVYVSWKSQGWINYSDAAGKWYVVSKKSGTPLKESPVSQTVLDLFKNRPTPTKRLADAKYRMSPSWEFTVTDNQIEFRSSNREGILIIRPYTEGFTFNGQAFGGANGGATKSKPNERTKSPGN